MKIARYNLMPDAQGRASLAATFDAYGRIGPLLDGKTPRHRSNPVELNRIAYEEIRRETGLHSRLVQNAIREYAAGVWSPDRLPIDEKLFSMKGVDRVSLVTVDGRLTVHCTVAGYEDIEDRGVFSHLVRDGGGFSLLATLSQPLQSKEIPAMQIESAPGRVSRLAAGLVNSIVDALEAKAPEAVAEQAIREIDTAIKEAQGELATAEAERKRLMMRRDALREEMDGLHEKVRLAVQENREDLARVGIARQDDIEAQIASLDKLIAAVDERIDDATTALRAAAAARRDAFERVQVAKRAKASDEANGSGAARSGKPGLAERIGKALASVERVTDLPAGAPRDPALDELDAFGRDKRIEARLAAIKRELRPQD